MTDNANKRLHMQWKDATLECERLREGITLIAADRDRLKAEIERLREVVRRCQAPLERAVRAEAEIERLRVELEDAQASIKAAYHQGAIKALKEKL